jgi:hypothetical protein
VSGNTHQPDLATLRAIVEAVRRDPPPARRATQVAPAPLIALLALLLAGFLHARAFHAWTPRPASVPPAKEFTVKFAREMAVASSFALASTCLAQDAVQWRVQDGGNGHWYAVVVESVGLTWSLAHERAMSAGGHLASVTSVAEDELVFGLASPLSAAWSGPYSLGPWLGGFQQDGAAEPAGGWAWVTGEPWDYRQPATWNNGEELGSCGGNADNGGGGASENSLHYMWRARCWNDAKSTGDYFGDGRVRAYVVEWSADCNADGIVDYGQIRAGELDDANGNNIPDCCESGTACDCVGDVDDSGAVNGVDLSIILNAWGVGGGKYPEADVNGDGTVDAIDLSFVLNAWGPCN